MQERLDRLPEAFGILDMRRVSALRQFDQRGARIADKAPAGRVLIDVTRVGEVGDEVLRDRRHLAGDGVIVAVVAIGRQTGTLVGEPEIVARGFVGQKL